MKLIQFEVLLHEHIGSSYKKHKSAIKTTTNIE